uniref:Uncharacterized protein n=1 Tax=Pipistrellus kuhlii TaxID=59472 RepID=A0A7J8A7X0_PIPKU|nr:hypothetical protein mPipKuh1_008856 [Pipistrellus kuhlii]
MWPAGRSLKTPAPIQQLLLIQSCLCAKTSKGVPLSPRPPFFLPSHLPCPSHPQAAPQTSVCLLAPPGLPRDQSSTKCLGTVHTTLAQSGPSGLMSGQKTQEKPWPRLFPPAASLCKRPGRSL